MHLKKNTCSQCPKCPQCPLCLCTMSTMCTMCTMSTMFTMSTMSQIHHFYVGNGVRSNSGRSLFPDRQGTVFFHTCYTVHFTIRAVPMTFTIKKKIPTSNFFSCQKIYLRVTNLCINYKNKEISNKKFRLLKNY